MREKHLIFIIFLSIFVANPVYAAEITTPHLVEQLNLDFEQYGTVQISRGDVSYIALNISTLQESENQKAIFFGKQNFGTDEFRNKKLMLLQKSSALEFKYSVKGSTEILGIHTYTLPKNYRISESEKRFLLPTENIQSNNPTIRELAENITQGSKDEFEKVARLAIWINNNVNYTLDLGSEAKDAIWVLNNKIGTCDEFSTLFIAMARSIEIPAKYVSGWVYGGSGWQKHAWAEVYLGKWIPVDATWLEAGNLDATHIKFMETSDNYVANQAKALGTDLGKIEWKSDDAKFLVKNVRHATSKTYEMFSSTNTLGLGKSAVIGIKIMPEEYSVDEFNLVTCKGLDIIRIDKPRQNAIMKPGEEMLIFWKVSANNELNPNSVYTCPLSINSRLFERKTVELTVDPRVTDSIGFEAKMNKYIAAITEDLVLTVYFNESKYGGLGTIGVISKNTHHEKKVSMSEAGMVKFSVPAEPEGKYLVYAYSDRGNALEIKYDVYETGEIFIDKINAPLYVKVNEPAHMEIYVKNSMHGEGSSRLAVKLNGEIAIDENNIIKPKSVYILNISIPSGNVGLQRYAIKLTSDSIEEKLKEVRVYDIPEIETEGSYDSKTKSAVLKLTSSRDNAKEIYITVGKESARISSIYADETESINFEIPEGTYDVKIAFADASGEIHNIERKIDFRKQGIMGYITGFYYWIVGLF